jgi:hypothetical protein
MGIENASVLASAVKAAEIFSTEMRRLGWFLSLWGEHGSRRPDESPLAVPYFPRSPLSKRLPVHVIGVELGP